MTVLQQDTDAVSAEQVEAAAEVFGLGLPAPRHVAIYSVPRSPDVSSVNLQFRGPGAADKLRVWADYFGAAVTVTPSIDRPASWHKVFFTCSGVLFEAYAEIETGQS